MRAQNEELEGEIYREIWGSARKGIREEMAEEEIKPWQAVRQEYMQQKNKIVLHYTVSESDAVKNVHG